MAASLQRTADKGAIATVEIIFPKVLRHFNLVEKFISTPLLTN